VLIMEISIKRWGNSWGIRIPQKILNSLHIKESQKLNMEVENGKLILEPISKELDILLSQINQTNLHDEVIFSEPQGSEVW